MTNPTSTATDLLVELVRADTVAAEEGALARRCAGLLADAGLTGSLLDFEPGREQYVGRVGGDSPLTFTGHLDTVPATPSDWTVDPWAAEPDGDRLVGRGTSDMKSGVAALVTAVADHVRRPHDCRGVQVVLTAGRRPAATARSRSPRRRWPRVARWWWPSPPRTGSCRPTRARTGCGCPRTGRPRTAPPPSSATTPWCGWPGPPSPCTTSTAGRPRTASGP